MQLAQVQISDSIQQGLNALLAFIPNLIGFLLILVVGYFVAKIIKAIVRKGLEKLKVDQKLDESDARQYVDRVMPDASPANGISRIVFYFVFAFFLFSAIGALQIPALTTFMNSVLAYIPNVIAAIAIFVIAAVVAGAAGGGAAKLMGDTPTGKIVGTVVPALVMVIAVFMILSQLQIAPDIVQIAFAATMGALALGLALAFGLGARPVAQDMLQKAYDKGREQKDQVKQDAQLARDRGQRQAEQGKQRAQQEVGQGGDSGRYEQPTRQQPGTGSYRAT